jgi:excinuclease ABC subunit A
MAETATAAAPETARPRRLKERTLVVRGARQHNLKGLDLDLPHGRLIVVTGPSGSGKSSLAFDTIYAEGQRRYVESLSAYARQFLERMDKPDVDYIAGLAPALAIQQSTAVKNPRSTVATQTEVYDYLRLLYARIGVTYSPLSGARVTKDSPRSVAEELEHRLPDGTRFYLTFAIPDRPAKKGQPKVTLAEELEALRARGFFRVLVLPTEAQARKGAAPEVVDLNETDPTVVRGTRERVLVLVDRLAVRAADEPTRSRIADSTEQAFREGGGRAAVVVASVPEPPPAVPTPQKGRGRKDAVPVAPSVTAGDVLTFSEFFERDGMRFDEPSPLLFSFNSPVGACPTCQGFGRVPGVDPDLVVPNPDLTIRQGALAPFRTEQWSEYLRDLIREASRLTFPIDTPYRALTDEQKKWVWEGSGGYAGVTGFFKFLESKSYKMHYRIYAARFRGYTTCPTCDGYRVRPEALYVKVGEGAQRLHIGEACELTTKDALDWVNALTLTPHEEAIAGTILAEARKRLRYLVEVGLDYLTLDRLSMTLSGGENQRIHLATSLGSALVGSLYVLDEPSIGLHPRDTDRLISILAHMRDIGNTVLVVEHEPEMMRRADLIVDIGPGSGREGGSLVFFGPYEALLEDENSLTGAYLAGRKKIETPTERRAFDPEHALVVEGAREHNLKHVDVAFPLGTITCVTGVSGSGKSTLVHSVLYNALRRLKGQFDEDARVGAHDALRGAGLVDAVELVDQSPIGKTSRSNPVSYVKAWDNIRNLLADTHAAKLRGFKPATFSFNVPGGRCEVCEGEGEVRVEMQFLADLYLECEACKGRRFKQEVLEVRYKGKNVDDILRMTVREALPFFEESNAVAGKLRVLDSIGLGYLTLGQPSNTLSGGEAQRVKLGAILGKAPKERTLYLFDEPTTGLHFDDVRKLLAAFNALVDAGHSVILIEHNLDVIRCSDYVIDLGPEGGRGGGRVVAAGTPEALAAHPESHTGRFLRGVL